MVLVGQDLLSREGIPSDRVLAECPPLQLGLGWLRTSDSLFTGPDGVQYRWALGAFGFHHPKVSIFFAGLQSSASNHIMKPVTFDEKKTVIAEFHPARYLVNRRKARLEVKPMGWICWTTSF